MQIMHSTTGGLHTHTNNLHNKPLTVTVVNNRIIIVIILRD